MDDEMFSEIRSTKAYFATGPKFIQPELLESSVASVVEAPKVVSMTASSTASILATIVVVLVFTYGIYVAFRFFWPSKKPSYDEGNTLPGISESSLLSEGSSNDWSLANNNNKSGLHNNHNNRNNYNNHNNSRKPKDSKKKVEFALDSKVPDGPNGHVGHVGALDYGNDSLDTLQNFENATPQQIEHYQKSTLRSDAISVVGPIPVWTDEDIEDFDKGSQKISETSSEILDRIKQREQFTKEIEAQMSQSQQ